MQTEMDLEIEISGTLVPYRPARMYERNGDPGSPSEGGYCEDVGVFIVRKNGKFDITMAFTDNELEKFGIELYEHEMIMHEQALAEQNISRGEADRDEGSW